MQNRHERQWGVTAHSTQWAALDSEDDAGDLNGGYGFVRVVEPGVVYVSPPLVEGLVTWAETPRTRGRGFAMAWQEDVEPVQVRTLLDFHAELAPRRATLAKDDAALCGFDDAVLQMVRLVERLHRAGGTLGYVQPRSIVFCTLRDGRVQPVFPDVGFLWDDQRGLMEPKWITNPDLGLLFERGARNHNSDCLRLARGPQAGGADIRTQAADIGAAQAADVRLLAKLIAVALAGPDEVRRWCGEGCAFLKMPGRNVASDTQAPIWDQVIAPTLLGGVKTAAELAQRLEGARPSEHFLFKPPAPPPIWKKVARRSLPAIGGLALLAMLGVIAKKILEDDRPLPPLCPTVRPGSELYPKLFELVGLQTAALQEGKVREYWDELQKCKTLAGGGDCIPTLMVACAATIDDAARGVVRDLRQRPLPPAKARQRLEEWLGLVREAISAVGEAPVAKKLSQTARFLGVYLQSLGGPGLAESSAAVGQSSCSDP